MLNGGNKKQIAIIALGVVALLLCIVSNLVFVNKFFGKGGKGKEDQASAIESTEAASEDEASDEASDEATAKVSVSVDTNSGQTVNADDYHMMFFDGLALSYRNWTVGSDFALFKGDKCFSDYLQEADLGAVAPAFEEGHGEFETEDGLLKYDGRYYWFTGPRNTYVELPEGAIAPNRFLGCVEYVVPYEQGGVCGDLFSLNSYDGATPRKVLSDVVGTDVAVYSTMEETMFLYVKEVDGKRSLMKTVVPAKQLSEKEEVAITPVDTVLEEGNFVPLGRCFYYDLDKKDMYYFVGDQKRVIYTGDYDAYYVFQGQMVIEKGADVYYFTALDYSYSDTDSKAELILTTGLTEFCEYDVVGIGYHNGYTMPGDPVIKDKAGKEYFIYDNVLNGKKLQVYELDREIEDDKVEMFGEYMTYIEDGVLYVREYSYDGVNTYVKFDTAPVVDYCYGPGANYFLILTENGDLYCQDRYSDGEPEFLVDSGVDFCPGGDKGNFIFDRDMCGVVYSKDGKFWLDALNGEEPFEVLEGEHGYFVRDKGVYYFVYDTEDEAEAGAEKSEEGEVEPALEYFYNRQKIYKIM